jgi:dTDP-4-amino-4,6-dideoxygalactose transaminase
MSTKIPFIDLKQGTREIRAEINEAISRVIDNTAYVLGPELEAFEGDFAAYCGTSHCAGVNSGTGALHLTLLCCNIGPGDEVITVPNTFIATAEAIAMTGAKPVLVDVCEDTALMDIERVSKAVTPRTKAVIPVHLFGQPCDMEPLMELAKQHGFIVIEDACQAHGAQYNGRKTGALGHAAAFSFYPSKNLGACGEGGAITSGDARIIERAKALRHHAQFERNVHREIGFNYRLESLQAAILRVKLRHLDGWNEKRREIATRYINNLKGTSYWLPKEASGRRHVYHLFPIVSRDKEKVTDALTGAGIGWGEHYPIPVHMHPAFAYLGKGEGSFPAAERLMRGLVSLPMFPELSLRDVDRVSEVLREVDRSA